LILTGLAIESEVKRGRIVIAPFSPASLNPNSYNYHLSENLLLESGASIKIPAEGCCLEAGSMVLGATYEKLGSEYYAMSLIGRSSVGRLGLFLQISANLGHTGSAHCWTLEIYATKSIWLVPNMRIGQISFWTNSGAYDGYVGKYASANIPFASRIKDD
jgi:dCTP deaminase